MHMMDEQDNYIEEFEKYITGEFSEPEQTAFEQQLREDKTFADAFAEHRKLRKGIEWASISGTLAEVRKIHDSLEAEDLTLVTATPVRRLGIGKWLSVAAALVFGVLMTVLYFEIGRPTKPGERFVKIDDQKDQLYGTGGDEIPIYEALHQVVIEGMIPTGGDGSPQVLIQVFSHATEKLLIDTFTNAVIYLTPYEHRVEDLEKGTLSILYRHGSERITGSLQFIGSSHVIGIPMTTTHWDQLKRK